jgi:LysM domain
MLCLILLPWVSFIIIVVFVGIEVALYSCEQVKCELMVIMNCNAFKRLVMALLVGVCCFVDMGAAGKKRAGKQGYLSEGPSMKERYSEWVSRGAMSEAVWLRRELGVATGRIEELEKELDKAEREVWRLKREKADILLTVKGPESREEGDVNLATVIVNGGNGQVEYSDRGDTSYEDIEVYFVKTRTYVVKDGDTLWSIAADEEIYGDPFRWIDIYNANKTDLDSTNKEVVQGMYLRIPRDEDKAVVRDDADSSAGTITKKD